MPQEIEPLQETPTVTCEHCENDVPESSGQYLDCMNGHVCQPCIDSSAFSTCDGCSEIVPRRSIIRVSSGSRICQSCYENNYFTCASCGVTIHNDYYAEDGRCESCNEESSRDNSVIHDYGYEIPSKFLGKGPHYYGVELEMQCPRSDENDKAEACLSLLNKTTTFAFAKHDGSLDDRGFELVTVPASLEEQKKNWQPFFDRLPEGLRSFDTKTCGLHVHCSRRPLSTLTVGKIVVFVNKRENQSFVETIAGRPTGQWAAYKDKKHNDARTDSPNLVRYEAVNLLNYNTIEFRIFKGTLKKASVFKAIEFCDAIIRFCLPAAQSIPDAADLEKFIDYVKTNKKTYPHLWGFISAKWLKLPCKEADACGYVVTTGEQ